MSHDEKKRKLEVLVTHADTKGLTVCGVPVEELSREELIAALALNAGEQRGEPAGLSPHAIHVAEAVVWAAGYSQLNGSGDGALETWRTQRRGSTDAGSLMEVVTELRNERNVLMVDADNLRAEIAALQEQKERAEQAVSGLSVADEKGGRLSKAIERVRGALSRSDERDMPTEPTAQEIYEKYSGRKLSTPLIPPGQCYQPTHGDLDCGDPPQGGSGVMPAPPDGPPNVPLPPVTKQRLPCGCDNGGPL